jgi:hypothetical protein
VYWRGCGFSEFNCRLVAASAGALLGNASLCVGDTRTNLHCNVATDQSPNKNGTLPWHWHSAGLRNVSQRRDGLCRSSGIGWLNTRLGARQPATPVDVGVALNAHQHTHCIQCPHAIYRQCNSSSERFSARKAYMWRHMPCASLALQLLPSGMYGSQHAAHTVHPFTGLHIGVGGDGGDGAGGVGDGGCVGLT